MTLQSARAEQVRPTPVAIASRDCAKGLLRTARQWKVMARPDEVARLVKAARWHWHWYVREIA